MTTLTLWLVFYEPINVPTRFRSTHIIAADKNFGKVHEKAKPYKDKVLLEFISSGDLIVL